MTFFALFLSILYVFLLSKYTKCVAYTMIILTTVVIVASAIIFFAYGSVPGGIIMIVFLLLWLCILCCFKDSLEVGIKLLQLTGNFLLSRPSVFFIPIIVTIFGLIFIGFWIWSLIAIILDYPNTNQNSTSSPLVGVWCLLSIFYTTFISYVMVFLIATATAFWYFQKDDSYCLKGMKWIITAHIGSFTFASLIITLVKSASTNY